MGREEEFQPRLVVFDYDGTLVDSQHAIVAAMGMAFARAELAAPPPANVRRTVGLSLEAAILDLLGSADAEEDTALVDAIGEGYRQAYLELRRRPDHIEPLFPGVRELLAGLDRPPRFLGIATGKARRGLHASLERHDLAHHFATLQTSDANPGKPDPTMLFRAIDDVGVEPDETLMIGDTVFDIEMAKNAKIRALGVAWGYHRPEELSAAGAAAILKQPGDLLALLASREKEAT